MPKILKVSSRSNGLPLLYEHETWCMESSLDAQILKVSSSSPGVTQGQMAYHCCMNMKLGAWSHLWMLKIMKGSSRSPGATQGQITHNNPLTTRLGLIHSL